MAYLAPHSSQTLKNPINFSGQVKSTTYYVITKSPHGYKCRKFAALTVTGNLSQENDTFSKLQVSEYYHMYMYMYSSKIRPHDGFSGFASIQDSTLMERQNKTRH